MIRPLDGWSGYQSVRASKRGFDAQGFAALEGFLAGELVEEIEANLSRFIEDIVPGLPREHVFYEDKNDASTLKQIQQMGQHDAYFGEWMNSGPFRETAELLLDSPVVPQNMQYFNKPAGLGQATPPHQDGYYFMLDPCVAVTMWFALDDVDEENGCVRYVPGSHKRGMRPHGRTKTLGFSQGITDFGTPDDAAAEVMLPARPGDLLVHHAMTIHRASRNASPTRSRRALGFIYYSENAKQDTVAFEAYQRRLKNDMKGAGRI